MSLAQPGICRYNTGMSVFRKRDSWWIGYRASDGRWRREPVGSSHKLAKEVHAKRVAEVAERKHYPGRVANAQTFNQFTEKFWDLHGQYLKSSAWKSMFPRLKECFGKKKIGTISPGEIQRYYNEVADRTSFPTANRHLTLLHLVFNKAKLWGDFYGDNPCGGIRKGREHNHRLRYLSNDEILRLFDHASDQIVPMITCAILTGMRKGEVLELCWENLDLQRKTIHILKSKSGKKREIPIMGRLNDTLLALGPKETGLVFTVSNSTRRRHFKKALQDAGISNFVWHDLRHTFASHFVMRTRNLPALQSILGHSTPNMTNRYAHLAPEHLQKEMAALEDAIFVPAGIPCLPLHQGLHQADSGPIPKV